MTDEEQEELLQTLRRIDGLFVGQLTQEELSLFNQACDLGLARRLYEGGAGFLGLARVRSLHR